MTTRFALQSFIHDVMTALWFVYRNPSGPISITLTVGSPIPRGAAASRVQTMTTLPNTHKAPMSLEILDIAGNPAAIDGTPSWSSSDTTVVTLGVAPDGLSAFAISGNVGTAQVTVTADADLGQGTRTLTALEDFDVVASEAVTIGIKVGPIEPK